MGKIASSDTNSTKFHSKWRRNVMAHLYRTLFQIICRFEQNFQQHFSTAINAYIIASKNHVNHVHSTQYTYLTTCHAHLYRQKCPTATYLLKSPTQHVLFSDTLSQYVFLLRLLLLKSCQTRKIRQRRGRTGPPGLCWLARSFARRRWHRSNSAPKKNGYEWAETKSVTLRTTV